MSGFLVRREMGGVARRRISWRYAWLAPAMSLGCGCVIAQTASTPAASTAATVGAPASAVPAASKGAGSVDAEADKTQDVALPALANNLMEFTGKRVDEIRYEGVEFDKTDRLQAELSQKAGEPLDPDKVRQMTRRLFATGRYRDISVRVQVLGEGVAVIFVGVPRFYVGRVQVVGVTEDRLTSLLEYGSKLNPGAAFTRADLVTALAAMKEVMAQNGYYQPTIAVTTKRDDVGQQMNVTFTVAVGPVARVGSVTIAGTTPGVTEKDFRKKSKAEVKDEGHA